VPKKITEQAVREAKPKAKRYTKTADGLTFEVHPSGKKSFYAQYREHGRKHKELLGHYPALSVKEAKKKVLDIQHRLKVEESPVRQTSLTFRDFIEGDFGEWVVTQRKDGQSTINRLRYQYLAEDSRIADKKLKEVTTYDVELQKSFQIKKGYADSTVKRNLGDLRRVFTKAVEWGFLRQSPATPVSDPKVDSAKERLYLSDEEMARLESALQEWHHKSYFPADAQERKMFPAYLLFIVRIALQTGMRRGEILSLRWSDVDRENRMITVRGDVAKSAKTRRLPISDKLAKALWEWSGLEEERADVDDPVFPVQNFKRTWSRLREMAELDITFHQLRHHFASSLVLRGTALHVVKELLGHTSIETTQIYLSVRREDAFEAVNRL